jgi:hypothetical protein
LNKGFNESRLFGSVDLALKLHFPAIKGRSRNPVLLAPGFDRQTAGRMPANEIKPEPAFLSPMTRDCVIGQA